MSQITSVLLFFVTIDPLNSRRALDINHDVKNTEEEGTEDSSLVKTDKSRGLTKRECYDGITK